MKIKNKNPPRVLSWISPREDFSKKKDPLPAGKTPVHTVYVMRSARRPNGTSMDKDQTDYVRTANVFINNNFMSCATYLDLKTNGVCLCLAQYHSWVFVPLQKITKHACFTLPRPETPDLQIISSFESGATTCK